jgi:hypothetical protein
MVGLLIRGAEVPRRTARFANEEQRSMREGALALGIARRLRTPLPKIGAGDTLTILQTPGEYGFLAEKRNEKIIAATMTSER